MSSMRKICRKFSKALALFIPTLRLRYSLRKVLFLILFILITILLFTIRKDQNTLPSQYLPLMFSNTTTLKRLSLNETAPESTKKINVMPQSFLVNPDTLGNHHQDVSTLKKPPLNETVPVSLEETSVVPQTSTVNPHAFQYRGNPHQDVTTSKKLSLSQTTPASAVGETSAAPESVVNPHPYHYVRNPHQACFTDSGRHVHVLMYVYSAAANLERRMSIRRTWGDRDVLRSYNASLVFVLGTVPDPSVMNQIGAESQAYKDIVQGSFPDTYQTLTRKGLAALRWASTFCSGAAYLLKTDDDVHVNTGAVMKFIRDVVDSPPSTDEPRLIVCNLWTDLQPNRERTSKWYVSWEQYKGTHWPPFCQGMGYVISGDLAPLLFQASLTTPFLWLEDVYITGLLAQRVGVRRKAINQFYSGNGVKPKEELFFIH